MPAPQQSSTSGTLTAAVAASVDIPVLGYARATLVISNTGASNAIGTNELLLSPDGSTFSENTAFESACGSIAAEGTALVEIEGLCAKTLRVRMTSSSGSSYTIAYALEPESTGPPQVRVNGTVIGAQSSTGALTVDDLTVADDATIGDQLTVNGDITIADDLTIGDDVVLAKEVAHTITVAASTTTDTAGAAITITSGAAAATNANGGALTLDAGAKAGSGTDGAITIGGTNAESVTIGRTGKTTTVPGSLTVTQTHTVTGATVLNGAVTLGDAIADAVIINGAISIEASDASGTPGNCQIDKMAGRCAIALGAAAVTVTNSNVTAASLVFAQLATADATLLYIKSVVPGAGSFVVTGNATATADTKVNFLVINPS
jgi:hypothetical protein